MKEITEVQQNIDRISFGERDIFLCGTAHVSRTSAELVREAVETHQPDVICVELCEPRLSSLQNPELWRETDVFEVVKTGRAYVLLAQLILSSFQKRLAEQFGVRPGEEMREAIRLAEEKGIRLEVVDREIRITLKRAWAEASFWSLLKLSSGLFASLFTKEEISEQEIEALKSGDTLSAMMSEFSDYLPEVKNVLIDERDRYMAAKIYASGGHRVLAVVGAGHVPGIQKTLGADVDLASLETLPPTRGWIKMIAWGVPALILGMFIYGFVFSGAETSLEMLWVWFLANGSLSALGALLALAHPLTILTAFVAAPITSLNPTIAAGWVCGLVEALLRKPRVKDLETLADDVASVQGFWKNRVSKVLLVIILANLGSVVGTLLGSFKVASLLP